MSKVWELDIANKKVTIPKRFERPVSQIVKHIIDRTIKPILWADNESIEAVYMGKITSFQGYCMELIQLVEKSYSLKQRLQMDLSLYDKTISLVNSEPIFSTTKESIIETVEILKDYEMNIYHVISTRLPDLEKALKEIDAKEFLKFLYGSYIALICFWYVAYNANQNKKTLPAITEIAHKLAKELESYTETIDILSNPEEMALINKSEEVEKLS
jgi:hypothetical protein